MKKFSEVKERCNFSEIPKEGRKLVKHYFAFNDARSNLYTEPFSAIEAEHAVMLVLQTLNLDNAKETILYKDAEFLKLCYLFSLDFETGEIFNNVPFDIVHLMELL